MTARYIGFFYITILSSRLFFSSDFYRFYREMARFVNFRYFAKAESEKRKQFLENAMIKRAAAKQSRGAPVPNSPCPSVRVEGPRSKKPTLAKSWRLEKTGQKLSEE